MTIAFTAMNEADHDDLVSFLRINTYPHHAGRFRNAASRPFWITDGGTWLRLVVSDDLHDDTPVFDLRHADAHRGNRLDVPVFRFWARTTSP